DGLCGAPPLRPNVRRGVSLQSSLARVPAVTRFARPSGQPAAVTPVGRCLVYQSQLSIRGQGASMPLATRLESSKRCYWLCQTSGWPEWAVTTPAASPATFNSVRYAHKSQKARKPESQKARKQKNDFRPQAAKIYSDCCGFSRPNRASPQVKKYGSHARMIPGKDRGTGRALRSVGLTGFF